MVAPKIHGEPTDYYGHSRVGSRGDKEERPIFDVMVEVLCHEDGETSNGDADWNDGEEESMASPIRQGGN